MALKITRRNATDVPAASGGGSANEELAQLKSEMAKLAAGMVIEIDAGTERSVRGTKNLITRASKQLNRPFMHWHHGTVVYAKPVDAPRRRGRPPKVRE